MAPSSKIQSFDRYKSKVLSGDNSKFSVEKIQSQHKIHFKYAVLDGQGEKAPLDCQSKSNREIEKGLTRATKARTLSGTLVQTFYNPQNILVLHTPEIEPPGQIFANESVRILVCTPLPGGVGMGKVHRSPQGGGYLPVPGKLLATVRRQAAALQPIRQTDQGNLNSSRSLVLYLCCQQQASLSVNHGNQTSVPGLPRTVSTSQSPMSSLCRASLGRSSMETLSLRRPRPSCRVFLQ